MKELNQLVNPLQSRCSFSDSDIKKLFPSNKKPPERVTVKEYLQKTRVKTTTQANNRKGSNEDQKASVSISDIIKENELSKHITSKEQLSLLIFTVFAGIFYKAVKSHFVCPICNDFLRKPKMLPSCGHMFCSHCLAYWFTNNPLRSCPVCRRFSTQNQAPIPTYTVSTFIEKTEKLRKYFKTQRKLCDDNQMQALLAVLGLPGNEKNQNLLAYLIPGYRSFQCKSLENLQKKWAFQQLAHNLRFAQRQATNRYSANRSRGTGLFQRYRQQILEVIKMICPFYSVLAYMSHIISLVYTGRLMIVYRRPNVDQVCMIFIAVMLAVFTIMVFNFAIQKGMKTQIKMLLHFTIVVMVNDFINPP
jgi:hypothetical protein